MCNKNFLLKILKWIPSLIIAFFSFYFSCQEHLEYMPSFWNADKLVHFICFAGFCFWVSFACNIKNLKQVWLPVLIISLWGISDEFHQSFVPGRSVSFYDWLCDTTGGFLGALFYIFIRNKALPICLKFFKLKRN